ncbi:MAG: T9SS type A sorting domain-containing protein [Flavobacteriales bacterium]|nr:T9SS type A sorting domain-containing protein [Flavobacteriales bacterium]
MHRLLLLGLPLTGLAVPNMAVCQNAFAYELYDSSPDAYLIGKTIDHIDTDLYRVSGLLKRNDSLSYFRTELSANGSITSSTIIPLGADAGIFREHILTASDGAQLLSYSMTGNSHMVLTRIDPEGNPEWSSEIAMDTAAQFNAWRDGGMEMNHHYYALGCIWTFSDGSAVLMKLDSLGLPEAAVTFATGDDYVEDPRAVMPANNGELFTVSAIRSASSFQRYPALLVARWNTELQPLWSQRITVGYDCNVANTIHLPDDGLLMVGHMRSVYNGPTELFIMRMSGTGEVLWARKGSTTGVFATRAYERPDHTFDLVCRSVQSTFILLHLGEDGTLINGSEGSIPGIPVAIQQSDPDQLGGERLLVGGRLQVLNTTYCLRLDADGAPRCGSAPFTYTDTLITLQNEAQPLFPIALTAQVTSHSLQVLPNVISVGDLCMSTMTPDHNDVMHDEVWPTPSSGIVNIRLASGQPFLIYRLIDGYGRSVHIQGELDQASNHLVLDLSSLPSGIYQLLIERTDGSSALRLMRE